MSPQRKDMTQIPTWLASISVAAMIGMQSWILLEVVNLKIAVAKTDSKLEAHLSRNVQHTN
jgi:hypothetical protein